MDNYNHYYSESYITSYFPCRPAWCDGVVVVLMMFSVHMVLEMLTLCWSLYN